MATASVRGRAMLCSARLERAEGLTSPPASSGEPRAFPAPFGEITRGKWDGKLLMRRPRGVFAAPGAAEEPARGSWGLRGDEGALVALSPLRGVACGRGRGRVPRSLPHAWRSVSVSPQGPEEQPDQHGPAGRLPRPPRAEASVSATAAPPGSSRGRPGRGSRDSGVSPSPTAPPLALQGPLQQPHRLPERQRLPGAPQPPQAVSSSLGTPWPALSPGSPEEPPVLSCAPPRGIAGGFAP